MDIKPTKKKVFMSIILLIISALSWLFGFRCFIAFCKGCSFCTFFFIKFGETSPYFNLLM